MSPLEFIDVLGKYGTPLVITGGVLYAGWRLLRIRLNKLEEPPQADLGNHHFFLVMDRALTLDIAQLPIEDEGRALMVQDFLKTKFEVFRNRVREFLESHATMDRRDRRAFICAVSRLIACAVAEYEDNARRMGIPEAFLVKFAEWHRQAVEMTLAFVDDIGQDEACFRTNREAMAAILTMLGVAFRQTLLDAERTLGTLNGQLDGLVYRGIPLGKAH